MKSKITELADKLSKAVAKFQKEEGGTCQYRWSHGCHLCESNQKCATQSLCDAKENYDAYRERMRRERMRRIMEGGSNAQA